MPVERETEILQSTFFASKLRFKGKREEKADIQGGG